MMTVNVSHCLFTSERNIIPHAIAPFLAFAGFGLFNIFIQQNYNGGKYWADVSLKMVTSRAESATVRVKWIVYGQIEIWFLPPKQSIQELFSTYQLGMKLGDFSNSMYPLGLSLRFALFEGENLSLLSHSCSENLKKMVRLSFH